MLRDEHDAARDGWLPTARGGVSARLGEGFALRSAAYLGWRLPTLNELFRPFRAGLDATAANPELKPERLAGVEAGIDYARGRGQALGHGLFEPAQPSDCQRHRGSRARPVSGRRLRSGGRRVQPAAECRRGQGARRRSLGAMGERAVEPGGGREPDPGAGRSERRGGIARWPAAGRDAQVRGKPVGELAIGREGRGAGPAARWRAVRRRFEQRRAGRARRRSTLMRRGRCRRGCSWWRGPRT